MKNRQIYINLYKKRAYIKIQEKTENIQRGDLYRKKLTQRKNIYGREI